MRIDFELIGALIRLRYKLLWAKTRTRNGKIALFFVGYLLFVLLAALLAAGGLGAGMVAVRSGKAETVAQIVLGSLFVQALFGTVLMGFGMNAMFSDLELRRYPVTALERRLTRHLIAIVDPFWFLILALQIGLVTGLYVIGAASFGWGILAVVLLFLCNYLFARAFGVVVDRLMQHKSGSVVLLAVILIVSLGAGRIPVLLHHSPAAVAVLLRVLGYTPPFGAAAAMTQSGSAAAAGWGVILVWLAGLAAALVGLERRPAERRKVETTALSFDSPYDRAAAWFGAENAPLVAHWLRFYVRNNRFRAMTLLALPLVAFLTWNFGERGGHGGWFVAALGTFPIIAFPAVARFTVNQFGYAGGGFRRYFLLPVDPASALRTGSYASLALGAPLIPLAAIAWVLLAPVPFDARMLFMLLSAGVSGTLVFHGLGLWASIFGPRRGNYNQALGNDLSLAGNVIVIGGIFGFLLAPLGLKQVAPALVSPENWWIGFVAAALAVLFYGFSLRAAGALLHQRREQLMAVVEGRG